MIGSTLTRGSSTTSRTRRANASALWPGSRRQSSVASAWAGITFVLMPERVLLRGREAEEGPLDAAPAHPAVRPLVQAEVAFEQLRVVRGEPLDAVLAAHLLVRHGEEDDVTPQRQAQALEQQHGHQLED